MGIDEQFNSLLYSEPYVPDEVLAKLLDSYTSRLVYIKVSEDVMKSSGRKVLGFNVICPEGVTVVCVNYVTPYAAVLSVSRHLEVGCVMIVQSARAMGIPRMIMHVEMIKKDGPKEGYIAEWCKEGSMKTSLINAFMKFSFSKVKGFLDFRDAEERALKYLREVEKTINTYSQNV